MAYSTIVDLLLGDMRFGATDPRQKFVDDAFEEMNAKLGWLYDLPLAPVGTLVPDVNSWLSLPEHEQLLLKTINNRLASGRLILAQTLGGENTTLQAYGASLVKDALTDLYCLTNGEVWLDAIRADTGVTEINPGGPKISNYDDESLVLGFERSVMAGQPWFSRPGAL